MTTSTAPSISFEGWESSEDDRPNRENARVRLLVTQLGPVGKELIEAFPNLEWTSSDLKRVLDQYKGLRNHAESLMQGYDEPGHLRVIDRHKIGAAFILAVLEVRPLKLKKGCVPQQEGERLANSILAFRTALRIVATFSRFQGRSHADNALIDRWRRPVVFPKTRDGKAYRHHAYRALHHGYRDKTLNLPILASGVYRKTKGN